MIVGGTGLPWVTVGCQWRRRVCGLSMEEDRVCFYEKEENWESWGRKEKKKRLERREKIMIF